MLKGFYESVHSRWAIQASRDALPAVDQEGLARLLANSGMRRKFERGDMTCKFCRDSVSEATVYALIRDSGSVKAVCSRPDCVAHLVEWIEGR